MQTRYWRCWWTKKWRLDELFRFHISVERILVGWHCHLLHNTSLQNLNNHKSTIDSTILILILVTFKVTKIILFLFIFK